jgi:predicted ATPase
VVQKSADQLESTLLHLVQSGLLFQRGAPPQATYLFKHALIQDVAYGTLLRKQRRELHARIAEILQSQFAEIAENQPELLARHYTEAGLIDKAVGLWGKAGRRSLQRSALIEAAAQFTRALHQIATLPSTPALRREEIEIQVGLITPLLHVKGYAAPETRAAAERARLLIEQAEAIGEPPQDPLLLFSVLYGFWAANFVAFRGDEMRGFATQFFELAKSQGAIIPLIAGHRVMGGSLLFTGDAAEGRAHFNEAIALYDPSRHRPLAERFGQDVRVTSLSFRSWAQWLLGYPEASLVDANQALRDAREICQAATSIFALTAASFTHILLGSCAEAITLLDEVVALADEKNAVGWKALGTAFKGCALSLTDKAPEAIHMITTGMNGWRSTGATVFGPLFFVYLARAHAALNELDDARRCISEALVTIGTTKESWCEPEVHRIAGEIALNSRLPELAKAEAYFDRALTVARAHKAKSWELRATMSMARLWREHRDPQQARDLLAPVCGWFTEGHDTYDLREAKALLHALVALT